MKNKVIAIVKFRSFKKVTCIHLDDLRHYGTNAGTLSFTVFPATSIKFLFYVFLIIVQTSPDSQTETDTVTKKDQRKEWWKRKSVAISINEPWENEVDDLVAWTNSLDTDALED